ncbi:MAG: sporulation transcriptional regulator SpoIIID [Caldibacillus sp.]
MHDYIKERTLKIGKYIVETRKTVRVIAKEFGVSKSTVHKDLTERLPEINPELASKVKEILEYHKSVRHLRGGEATKLKYQRQAQQKKKEMLKK